MASAHSKAKHGKTGGILEINLDPAHISTMRDAEGHAILAGSLLVTTTYGSSPWIQWIP